MKILLTAINAKYIHSNLAVHSLKAAAGAYSSHVELAEFTINHRTEEILREIYLRKPEVLLFSCYIWNIEYVKELTEECEKVLPGVPIWLGGPEVSYDTEKFLQQHPQITGILIGEGEETFRRLAECYVNNDLEKLVYIPGVAFRSRASKKADPVINSASKAFCVNPQGSLCDMNKLGFAYEGLEDFEHRIIYYESSRGCPFSCSYCLSSIDKSVRFRDFELVKQELQFFLDAKVPQVKFVDRTFNCRRSHALAIWEYILKHDNGVTNFHFEIAADLLEEEELELISRMRPGLIQLEIGVQSTNPKTIEAIHRRMDLEKLKTNVCRIHAMGNIHQHLDLIAGLPYEDYESFARSFNEVFALQPEQLQLGFLKVLKGSRMYEEAKEYGIVYRGKAPYEVLYSNWLSFGEMLQLKAIEEMVEIYYNSHQFQVTLQELLPSFASAFDFFAQLADFYKKEKLDGRNHSRLQRYEILLDFICRKLPKEEKKYRELLTIDLYRRERVKSRPAFAPDQSLYKETLRRIQHTAGKQTHIEAVTECADAITYLIFDYEKRSPLTGDALVTKWEEDMV